MTPEMIDRLERAGDSQSATFCAASIATRLVTSRPGSAGSITYAALAALSRRRCSGIVSVVTTEAV